MLCRKPACVGTSRKSRSGNGSTAASVASNKTGTCSRLNWECTSARKLADSTGWTGRQPTTVGFPAVRTLMGRRGLVGQYHSTGEAADIRPRGAQWRVSGPARPRCDRARSARTSTGKLAHGVNRMGEQRDSWLAQGIPALFHAGKTSKCRKTKETVVRHSTTCPSRQRVSLRLVVGRSRSSTRWDCWR